MTNPNDVTVQLTGAEAKTEVGRMAAKGNSRYGTRKKGKYECEILRGHDYHRATGTFVRMERIIDRPNDHYSETVTNEATGEIVHNREEPLSLHFGHGSAKKK